MAQLILSSAPGAKMLADVWESAGPPKQNAWIKTPGKFENAPDGQYNKAQDEKRYVALIGTQIAAQGMPNYAIIDTGRNAVQGLRDAWGDWNNADGADFGRLLCYPIRLLLRPRDAFKPAPKAGAWNQVSFEMLLKNANPAS
ncbi:MAG: hypothetical protein MMC23_001397 [Stictis urceolatum]|nr:hypothetical protein [Stictis urceolata]